VHTRDLGNNERVLSDGTVLPVIPDNFWRYKLHNQSKSKRSRARKRQRTDDTHRTISDTEQEFALIREKFNLFTDYDTYASVVTIPPNLFTSQGSVVSTPMKQQPLVTHWDMLQFARQERPSWDNPFLNIKTIEELREHPNFEVMVQMYNVFFPLT